LKRVAQEFGLVGPRAVEFRTEDAFKIAPQLEVIDDPLGVHHRLAGRHEQTPA